MQLTTEYREDKARPTSGTKNFYLFCRVQFSHEERAVIQERGLYTVSFDLPSATPVPSESSIEWARRIGKWLMIVGGVVAAFSSLAACTQNMNGDSPVPGIIIALLSIAALVFGAFKFSQAERANFGLYVQKITVRRLLTNPEFLVHASTIDKAKAVEEMVRDKFAVLSQQIRDNTVVPEKNTYDL
jgi:hypothetical protein